MSQELIHVAYHEAGHFVAHHYLMPDDTSIAVTIVPNEERGSLGHHASLYGPEGSVRDGVEVFDPETMINFVITLYAGGAAELRLDPSREEGVRLGAGSDDEKAAAWLGDGEEGEHPGLGEPHREQELRERAKVFVAEHWHEIEAIAGELLVQKTIAGEVADMILELVNGAEDGIELVARGLHMRLGPAKATEMLARHGYDVRFVRSTEEEKKSR